MLTKTEQAKAQADVEYLQKPALVEVDLVDAVERFKQRVLNNDDPQTVLAQWDAMPMDEVVLELSGMTSLAVRAQAAAELLNLYVYQRGMRSRATLDRSSGGPTP